VLWLPLTVALMRFGLGWRIADLARIRRRYRELRADSDAPLLICPNHLTMVDSALVAWALGSPWWYLAHFSSLPWNTPERQNFAASLPSRVLAYLMKCVPITRGGTRQDTAAVLARVGHLLNRGEVALMFPEGGRARTGRVEIENAAHGVGRVVSNIPGCRVLCVYLRGERQETFSRIPRRGERFHVRLAPIDARSELQGLRRSIDVARQIVSALGTLEQAHFAARS